MRGRDRLHVPEIDERLGLDQRPGDQVAAQGRDDHGRQGGDGVGADDQLEGVEGAGERRAEAGRDGPAAPQPTRVRRSLRRTSKAMPSREARPEAICV